MQFYLNNKFVGGKIFEMIVSVSENVKPTVLWKLSHDMQKHFIVSLDSFKIWKINFQT